MTEKDNLKLHQKRAFFINSMILIGLINILHSSAETIMIPNNFIFSLTGITAGFVYLTMALFAYKNFDISKMSIFLIVTGVPFLSFRILTLNGIESSTSVWFVIFTIYALLFNSKKIVILTVLYSFIGFLICIIIETIYYEQLVVYSTNYPYPLKICLTIIALLCLSVHIYIYDKERKQLLDENRNHEIMLIHSSRFSSIGEMAGGIAHEINTPLCTIGILSQTAQEELQKGSIDLKKIEKNLTTIEKVVHKISLTTKALLNISRQNHNQETIETKIEDIIEDIKALSLHKLNMKRIEFEIDMPSDLANLKFHCRPNEIAQILIVLINNSIDAIAHFERKFIKLKVSSVGNEIQFYVQDSGSGIPLPIREKIFNPYFTTKPFGQGTGIGLSVAITLAKANGGNLSYIENENTTFLLIVPKKRGSLDGQNIAS